jgi:hypothetical protein
MSEYPWLSEIEPIPYIKPPKLTFGFFDRKGKFCSIRNKQRKFLKYLKEMSGINEELWGRAENE